jgi:phosphatidylglycerophosphatase A
VRGLVLLLATVGGVGYLPAVPGTIGSLVALPLLPALATLRMRAPLAGWIVVAALLAIAFWAADRADSILPSHDNRCIVIDEVAGMIVAGLFVPGTWAAAALVFVLFRALDVLKPWPANLIDRRVGAGLGVVGDDLVAGAYAGIAARLVLAVA